MKLAAVPLAAGAQHMPTPQQPPPPNSHSQLFLEASWLNCEGVGRRESEQEADRPTSLVRKRSVSGGGVGREPASPLRVAAVEVTTAIETIKGDKICQNGFRSSGRSRSVIAATLATCFYQLFFVTDFPDVLQGPGSSSRFRGKPKRSHHFDLWLVSATLWRK